MIQLPIVLASTSPYRKAILQKLRLDFTTASPDCSETALADESPESLVQRLALLKAKSCQLAQPSLVIGSDQVCVIDGEIVGKPHSIENAIRQLSRASGQRITFYTGIALFNSDSQHEAVALDTFHVYFRELSRAQIEAYVAYERPLNCAGSFKSEGLGIALFDRLEGKDPNTLIGLPLITLIDLLEQQGITVLAPR